MSAPKAAAHGTEFLLGKLTLSPGGMRLELTADCDANPMIADRQEAAAILPGALELRTGDEAQPLDAFAPVTLEDRTKFDDTAPLPPGALDNSIDHQLLTAVWQWQPGRQSVRFTVPKTSRHDVLLWMVDASKPQAEPRWMMLLGGDVTPEIALPLASGWRMVGGGWWILAGIASAALVAVGVRGRRRLAPGRGHAPQHHVR